MTSDETRAKLLEVIAVCGGVDWAEPARVMLGAALAAHEAALVGVNVDALIDALFVNGFGDEAARLVLTTVDGRDLGGWCKQAVRDIVLRHLAPLPAPPTVTS